MQHCVYISREAYELVRANIEAGHETDSIKPDAAHLATRSVCCPARRYSRMTFVHIGSAIRRM